MRLIFLLYLLLSVLYIAVGAVPEIDENNLRKACNTAGPKEVILLALYQIRNANNASSLPFSTMRAVFLRPILSVTALRIASMDIVFSLSCSVKK
jgi:hypothetical protein